MNRLSLFLALLLLAESYCDEAETIANLVKTESELTKSINELNSLVNWDKTEDRPPSYYIEQAQKYLGECKERRASLMWTGLTQKGDQFSYTEEFKSIMKDLATTKCPDQLLRFATHCHGVDYRVQDEYQFKFLEAVAASTNPKRKAILYQYTKYALRGEIISNDYHDKLDKLGEGIPDTETGDKPVGKVNQVLAALIKDNKPFQLLETTSQEYLQCNGTTTKDIADPQVCLWEMGTTVQMGVFKLGSSQNFLSVVRNNSAEPIALRKSFIVANRFSDGQFWTFEYDTADTFQMKNVHYDEIAVVKDGQMYTTKKVDGQKQAAWSVKFKPVAK